MPVRFDCKVEPRSGTIERSSSCSKKLLSVQDSEAQHHMLHARQAHWQSPVTNAPLLSGRSRRGDPQTVRARWPLIMMQSSWAAWKTGC